MRPELFFGRLGDLQSGDASGDGIRSGSLIEPDSTLPRGNVDRERLGAGDCADVALGIVTILPGTISTPEIVAGCGINGESEVPFFRRKSQADDRWNAELCSPIDPIMWWEDVARKGRPGFPNDGRYFLAYMVDRGQETCLVFELPATRSQAQDLFGEFARRYRRSPQRESETHFDDLDGVWGAKRFGLPNGKLIIVHPDFSDHAVKGIGLSPKMAAMGLAGSAAALDDPSAFFARDWGISTPRNRAEVNADRYGQLLDAALSKASPLTDLDPDGLDELQAVAQLLADHQPSALQLRALDSSALGYLDARLGQAKAKGMSTAATFRSRDRIQIRALSQAKDVADQIAAAALAQLQDAIRSVYASDSPLFESLNVQDSTLTWLYLDDIVDDRDAKQARQGTEQPPSVE